MGYIVNSDIFYAYLFITYDLMGIREGATPVNTHDINGRWQWNALGAYPAPAISSVEALLRCGVRGGGYSKINRHHYGCSTARNRGTCDNLLSIRRDILEESILEGLRDKLMHPDQVAEFAKEYHRELNQQAALNNTAHDRLRAEQYLGGGSLPSGHIVRLGKVSMNW